MVEQLERNKDLVAKHGQSESTFSNFRQEVHTSRRFYDLDFANEIVPPRWRARLEAYIPPNAAHSIDEAVDHILFTPRVRVATRPAEGDRQLAEQVIAENKRGFLHSIWAQNPIIHDARKTLINEGMIAIKKTINWKYVPSKPGPKASKKVRDAYRRDMAKLGQDHPLWNFEILDNATITFGPVSDHRNPMWVFIKYAITVEDARALYPKEGDPAPGVGTDGPNKPVESWRDRSDLEEVQFMEYWSADICDINGAITEPGRFIQWVEEEVIKDEMNPYPYVPVAIEDAGFGTVRSTAKVEDIFVGMTKKMRQTFINQARQFTAWEAVTELTAFGLYTARNRDAAKVWNVGPGEIIDLTGDEGQSGSETFEAVKLPEIPMGVIQLVNETNRMANSVLKTETLGGQPLSGVETATEADQQIRNASAKLSSPVAALERLVAKMSSWLLMDIELVFEVPVTIWASVAGEETPTMLTVKPSDINGYYNVTAELRTTDDEAVNMVKARFWSEMYRLIPFLSAWTAMERGEISDNPTREMVQRASEDIYLGPEARMVRTLTAMNSFGEFAEFIQAQIAGQGAGPNGPGGPPSPDANTSTPPNPGAGPSQPMDLGSLLGAGVPGAAPGGAGAARDVLQGPSQIRG